MSEIEGSPCRKDGVIGLVSGILLLICAMSFYYFSVLRLDYSRTILFDLGPHPDADEYFAQARSLVSGSLPFIRIGSERLPSRYPSGYPVLMLPWVKLLPEQSKILAPFRTNQSIGFLLLVGTFALYSWRRRSLDGGITVLLLATLPAFVTYSRSSLSDLSAAAGVAVVFSLVYLGLREKRRWLIYLAAAALGLAINVRMQLVFFAPILLAMALFRDRRSLGQWLSHCVATILLFLLMAGPTLVLNYKLFGSPLRTGYDFWVPAAGGAHGLFASRNVGPNLDMLWREITARRINFYVANIFGTGTSFVASFIVLAIIGVASMPKDRFFICATLGGATFFVATTFYLFTDARFYLPLLLLLVAAAAIPVAWAFRNLLKGWNSIAASIILVLFVVACLGYPSQSGYRPRSGRIQTFDGLHFADKPRRAFNFEAVECLHAYGAPSGIVFSDIDPVYLNALLGDSFAAAPLDEKHRYSHSQRWHYGKDDALALIQRATAQWRTVYALFVSPKDRDENIHRLPEIAGYRWSQVPHSPPFNAVIMELNPSPINTP